MTIQNLIDKLIGYGASAVAILGSIQNEMGANHDQHAIYVATAIAALHHLKPILEALKANLPAPPSTPKT